MSKYSTLTYLDATVPPMYVADFLSMAKDLIEYEQGLSVDITGKRRQVSSADSVERFLVPGCVVELLILDNYKLVGFCTHWFEPIGGRLVIDTLYIDPQHRGKGLAKKLLSYPMSMNYSVVDISVMVNNVAATKLYESFGFKPYITTMTMVK